MLERERDMSTEIVWQPIETAPTDGTIFKATHSNASKCGQTVKNAANCYFDGEKFQMSCFPISRCGRFVITGQPDLWMPISETHLINTGTPIVSGFGHAGSV
jgi:hypothetical protein